MPRLTPRPPFDDSWRAALDHWRLVMTAQGMRPATITQRLKQIGQLSRDLAVPLQAVTADMLVCWSGSHEWSPETRYSHHQAARNFFRDNGAAQTVREALPSIRRPQARPRPVPDAVYIDALRRARPRERLMLRLAGEAGMRRCEIAVVHRGDLLETPEGPFLVAHGKGGKARTIPITESLADELRGHYAGGWVFPGAAGEHLSAGAVGAAGAAALPSNWTLHPLRHRFASRAYAVDHDIVAVRDLLGHTSVATTQVYVATVPSQLRRAAEGAALATLPYPAVPASRAVPAGFAGSASRYGTDNTANR